MTVFPRIQKEAIDSCRAGDEKAFSDLVFCYQRKVFNIAYRMLGNMEEAKDLTQEVFLSVFKSIKGLREEVKFDAWLTQVTLNHCRNRWKHLKRKQYFNSDSLDDPIETEEGKMERSLIDSSDNPEASYEKKMVRQMIQDGLSKLKEDQRELIVLRDLQGLSYEELGEVFQLPEGTIKSKLHRARMELKGILEQSVH
jgi:RNA polymerase sigma-70 factor, ECF subfamily